MEDFARVHAQHCRIGKHFCGKAFRDFEERRRKCCQFCWYYRRYEHLDSEWHTFFACPFTERVRQRFRLALRSTGLAITLPSDWRLRHAGEGRPPEVHDLADFVAQCRMHKCLVIELARYVSDLLERRERLYRVCTARDFFFPQPLRTV